MKQLVSVNLTTKTAKNWTPPELTFGESLTLALRLFKNSEGQEIEANLTINSLKASIGIVDARPVGGKFAIKIGNLPAGDSNTTDLLDVNISASDLAAKLNAVEALASYGVARVIFTDGTWLMFIGDGSQQVPMVVVNNGLWPAAYGRISGRQRNGKWMQSLRLVQAPVAFTSSHDVVLPPQPAITRLEAGGTDGTFTWNEIQQLYVPAEFRGSYLIKRGFAKTPLLGPASEEDVDSIQAALQALGANCFKVSISLSNKPQIEFIGDYAGQPQDLLVTQVEQAPAGDLTFTIALDRDELATMLRRAGTVTLPLEITIVGTDEAGITGEQVALTLPVTIKPPVSFPELEDNPTFDLLRPYSPKTYVPFGASNEWIGEKVYPRTVGNGEAEEWVIATGLNSPVVFVWGRENIDGGRQLIQGTDFDVTIDNANQVTATSLVGPPALNAWVFIVFAANTVQQWAADLTVTVPQVIAGSGYPSLPAFMDNINERVENLEAVLPSTGPLAATSTGTGTVITIRKTQELLHYQGEEKLSELLDEKEGIKKVPEDQDRPYLLPAIHDAVLDALPDPLPAASGNAGKVYTAGVSVRVSPGSGIASTTVAAGGLVGCDGRSLFEVERDGETNSYYPKAFARRVALIAVDDKMLPAGQTFDFQFGVQVQGLDMDSVAQWVLRVDLGAITAASSPSPVGLNLSGITFAPPVIEYAFRLDPNLQTHSFGVRIKRNVGGMALDRRIGSVWSGYNDGAPASANFVLRGRMMNLDIEDAPVAPRGWIYLGLTGALDDGGSPMELRAIIK